MTAKAPRRRRGFAIEDLNGPVPAAYDHGARVRGRPNVMPEVLKFPLEESAGPAAFQGTPEDDLLAGYADDRAPIDRKVKIAREIRRSVTELLSALGVPNRDPQGPQVWAAQPEPDGDDPGPVTGQ